ncbi:GNAT family N-acetyltransferase [Flavobacterium orientale]|uniref:N-acetyltransferase n=1 Tax=Flavobacterium orientale TaxID=1756020 RepID=A0A916XUV3_9FLAO|nr:GNAT family N-acetyltransferase [Flavobacterium orientale]GGD13446.1 N-acetyltransferase [Flavobacterium orientale]
MKTIKEISSLETYSVRHPVLREGQSMDSCKFDGDDLTSTIHLGLYINAALVGVVSVFEKNHVFFDSKKQFQVRGMAVLKHHQKMGYGEELLFEAENHAVKYYGTLIWFNARENAVGFYEKKGYQICGDSFFIENIGKHFVMFKKLNPIRF